ncbi:MbtH family NRPS accessory protein [Streptomyces laurentii]|uniref:MbtH family NRPS accessory protein n=1 Tax=Streptomyces laurentii TaxID=39478 RepID=UPI00367D052D
MINPFTNESGRFPILALDEDQHSRRPSEFDIPAGWDAICGPGAQAVCRDTWSTSGPARGRPA